MAKTLVRNVVVNRTGYGPIHGNQATVPNDVAAQITNPDAWTLNAASEAAMLALSAATVGDVCIRTDTEPDSVYVLTATPPATLSNWTLLNPQTGPIFGGTDLATQLELSAAIAALSGTYAALRATITQAVDRQATLSALTAYARVDMNINALGKHAGSGRIYGSSPINGHWTSSDDNGANWTDRTFSPISAVPTGIGTSCVMMVITDSHMYAVGTAGSVFRAAKDVWNAWTDITPSGVPANTSARPDVLHHNGTALLYGNYGTAGDYGTQPGPGAYVWVSTDLGATWTTALSLTNARHVHAITSDSTGVIYATVGDSGGTPPWTQHGLYRSVNNGATFTRLDPLNPTYYGIGMVHPPAVAGVPNRVITEGDGPNPPHLMAWNKDIDVAGVNGLTPILWPDTSSAAGSWRGTNRGIALTAEGNIIFVSTSESGGAGTREGVWLAKGPWFDRCVLLEEVSGLLGVSWILNRGITAGPYVLNGRMRLTVPKFQGQ